MAETTRPHPRAGAGTLNHVGQAREPCAPPVMRLNPMKTSLFDFEHQGFELIGYDSHPAIKAQVAV
ncbi:MAG: thymidylate synthase [Rhodanobacter sp.]